MKKKILILLITVITILFVSCKEQSNYTNAEKPSLIINDDQIPIVKSEPIFEFTSGSYFFSSEYAKESMQNQVSQDDWTYYLEQMYDVKVIIHSVYLSAQKYSFETYIGQITADIEKGDIKGLCRILDLKTLEALIDKQLILPLNDYLELCSNSELIPDDWLNAYSIDGIIWGVPSQMSLKTKIRYIRNDWLENLDIEKPVTITEFYDAMKAFTYNDPDADGLDNTCGFSHITFNGLEDIFSSFDARLNYKSQLVPTWNPNTNKWEDSFLKPEMKDCLAFLKLCKDEKILLDYSIQSDTMQFSKGFAGSTYSFALRDILAKNNIQENRPNNGVPSIDYIFALEHKINTNISCYYTQYYSPIILTESSISPSTTFQFFIDNVVCNFDCYMHTRFNLDENQYSVDENNLLSLNLNEEELNNHYSPKVLIDNPIYQFEIKQEYDDESETQAIMDRYLIDQLVLRSSLCYQVPQFVSEAYRSNEYVSRLYEVSQLSRELFTRVIDNSISIEDAQETYRVESSKLKINDFIEMQNYKIKGN